MGITVFGALSANLLGFFFKVFYLFPFLWNIPHFVIIFSYWDKRKEEIRKGREPKVIKKAI